MIFLVLLSFTTWADLIDDYTSQVKQKMSDGQALQKKIKIGDRSICKGWSSKDYLSCLNRKIGETKITTSTEVALYPSLIVGAAMRDKNNKVSSVTAVALSMTDGIISFLEGANINDFLLTNLVPKTDVEKIALAKLKRDDEQILRDGFDKLKKVVTERLRETEKEIPMAPREQQPVLLQNLERQRKRIGLLSANKWTYPIQMDETRLAGPLPQVLCSAEVHKACNVRPIPNCPTMVKNLAVECAKKMPPAAAASEFAVCVLANWSKATNSSPTPECKKAVQTRIVELKKAT